MDVKRRRAVEVPSQLESFMKIVTSVIIIIAGQLLAIPGYAQDKSRVEVKAEAASAAKAGEIAKGEPGTVKSEVGRKSSQEERAAASSKRKAEATAAVKKGDLVRGEVDAADKPPARKTLSSKEKAAARAKRKADAASAVKSGDVPRVEPGTTVK
jgi:hypothetical protein